MSLSGIWLYCSRALCLAVPVALLWSVLYEVRRRRRKEVFTAGHFLCSVLFAAYLAALVQISVVRDWQDFFDLSHTGTKTEIIWIPLKTTLQDAQEMGILWECYHAIGNMAWFVPFGFLGAALYPRLRTWCVLPWVTLGVSFLLEFSQWIFQTGVSDVDDLILNTLGGCAGFLLWRLWVKWRKKPLHGNAAAIKINERLE